MRRQAGQVAEELNVKELVVHALAELFDRTFERPKDLLAHLTEHDVLVEDGAGYAVAVNTKISPDLADEGLARELVHRIQNMRKAAGFDISDRIVTYYGGWDRAGDVLARHGDYIRQETLSSDLVEGEPPPEAYREEQTIDGRQLTLAVRRAG